MADEDDFGRAAHVIGVRDFADPQTGNRSYIKLLAGFVSESDIVTDFQGIGNQVFASPRASFSCSISDMLRGMNETGATLHRQLGLLLRPV